MPCGRPWQAQLCTTRTVERLGPDCPMRRPSWDRGLTREFTRQRHLSLPMKIFRSTSLEVEVKPDHRARIVRSVPSLASSPPDRLVDRDCGTDLTISCAQSDRNTRLRYTPRGNVQALVGVDLASVVRGGL